MRWQIIPGVILAFHGLLAFVAGTLHIGGMVYFNIAYGPIAFSDGQFEALDRIALTTRNIIAYHCMLVSGITGLTASVYWFKKRIKYAVIITVLAYGLMAVAAALMPTTKIRATMETDSKCSNPRVARLLGNPCRPSHQPAKRLNITV